MTKIYSISTLVLLLTTVLVHAQPTKPATPPACNESTCTTTTGANPWDQCVAPNTAFISDFRGALLSSGTALTAGAVYRFKNVGNVSGTQINATVTVNSIFQAVLENIDDNASADPLVNVELFAPRIRTDAASLTTTDRRGYVQFTIQFYTEAAPLLTGFHSGGVNSANNNADFATSIALSNLNFIHYDSDGNTAGTTGSAWFRETGVVQTSLPGAVNVVAAGNTELKYYSYTDGGNNFIGFAGSVCERSSVSRCTQVAEYYKFNIPANQITFRLGYDYQGAPGASGNTGARQFGARFNCVNLPNQGSLPLTLVSLNVINKETSAKLVWETADEERFSHFVVERSTDARNFTPLKNEVQSRGAGRGGADYSYDDDIKGISESVIYYRLKMVNQDGSYIYSQVVSLKRGFRNTRLNISPNPASSSATIRFKTERSETVDLILSDVTGKIIANRKVYLQSGENNISIPEIAGLSNGLYTVRIITGTETVSDRIVVQK